MTHTPGPWIISERENPRLGLAIRPSPGAYAVATIHGQLDGPLAPHYDAEANACLIAAAPTTLKALKRAGQIIRDLVEGFQLHSECSRVNLKNELMNIQEDIARAEGRES